MPYRFAKVAGFSVLVDFDDTFRSSAIWQRVIRPGAHTALRTLAFGRRIVGSVTTRRPARREAAEGPARLSLEQQAIADRIQDVNWFQTIELPHGMVTSGAYDHRPLLKRYPIPERLDGKRVLDAGASDGFWSFEMERRGAAEVVALDVRHNSDLDLSPLARRTLPAEILAKRAGAGFEIARELIGSSVRREICSIYDLGPEELGAFDLVFCSDVLCLLSSPVQALRNLRSVTRGQAVIVDRINPYLPHLNVMYHGADEGCLWWSYSAAALEKMILDAGFSSVKVTSKFRFASRGAREWCHGIACLATA